jgi:hypothetical protein
VLAIVLFALIPVATEVSPLVALGGAVFLLWLVIAYENLKLYDERRYRLRHGEEVDPPYRGR